MTCQLRRVAVEPVRRLQALHCYLARIIAAVIAAARSALVLRAAGADGTVGARVKHPVVVKCVVRPDPGDRREARVRRVTVRALREPKDTVVVLERGRALR